MFVLSSCYPIQDMSTLAAVQGSTVQSTRVAAATKTSTKTLIPTLTKIPTPSIIAEMKDRINGYDYPKINKRLEDFAGYEIRHLQNFEKSANQTGYIYNYPIWELNPENFVAASHIKWSHGSTSVTKSSAGCGFIFKNNGENQIYFAVLTTDGNVRVIHLREGYWDGIAHKKYSVPLDFPNGEADLVVIVNGDWMTIAVNGEIVINQEFDWRSTGAFGYSILAGTNHPEGTNCEFTDTVLIIKD
jgi:hypothetical protein